MLEQGHFYLFLDKLNQYHLAGDITPLFISDRTFELICKHVPTEQAFNQVTNILGEHLFHTPACVSYLSRLGSIDLLKEMQDKCVSRFSSSHVQAEMQRRVECAMDSDNLELAEYLMSGEQAYAMSTDCVRKLAAKRSPEWLALFAQTVRMLSTDQTKGALGSGSIEHVKIVFKECPLLHTRKLVFEELVYNTYEVAQYVVRYLEERGQIMPYTTKEIENVGRMKDPRVYSLMIHGRAEYLGKTNLRWVFDKELRSAIELRNPPLVNTIIMEMGRCGFTAEISLLITVLQRLTYSNTRYNPDPSQHTQIAIFRDLEHACIESGKLLNDSSALLYRQCFQTAIGQGNIQFLEFIKHRFTPAALHEGLFTWLDNFHIPICTLRWMIENSINARNELLMDYEWLVEWLCTSGHPWSKCLNLDEPLQQIIKHPLCHSLYERVCSVPWLKLKVDKYGLDNKSTIMAKIDQYPLGDIYIIDLLSRSLLMRKDTMLDRSVYLENMMSNVTEVIKRVKNWSPYMIKKLRGDSLALLHEICGKDVLTESLAFKCIDEGNFSAFKYYIDHVGDVTPKQLNLFLAQANKGSCNSIMQLIIHIQKNGINNNQSGSQSSSLSSLSSSLNKLGITDQAPVSTPSG
ncbi:hypothetical protein SAMD00019534_117820 [Acytostelium subglobosum LB1]|uniref:hypothetical protein n=1 Tax=Acytostelium subglobosum LB1 TaxID=1410327 RepID=UPI00064485FF|nr:hypothetical protein SAMD00019534_117820 [Acytostelium subglobosum LB1]GAM28606.1 hypothetical protein SAMD00019534_117820 [Acytostelium subglobosum LB1]|eukprot:XP_012748384.1 hypothetical protein SAMD00019534_117820 [Acytostelium subglobosum LB1]